MRSGIHRASVPRVGRHHRSSDGVPGAPRRLDVYRGNVSLAAKSPRADPVTGRWPEPCRLVGTSFFRDDRTAHQLRVTGRRERTTIRGRISALRLGASKCENNRNMSCHGMFPPRVKLRQLFFAILSGAPVVATVVACSASSVGEPSPGGEPPCFPPAYSVSPGSVKPGEVVTVSAPAADCNPRYGRNAQIQVSVTDKAGTRFINRIGPMTDSGAFTLTFVVPAEIAVGEATVTAMPYNIDWCDDTGRNNRAEGSTNFERASCAVPVEPLKITR